MTEIRYSIDWFQYSVKWPDAIWEWPLEQREALPVVRTAIPYLDTSGWEPERDNDFRVLPMAGYSKTYDLLYASGHVDPNRPEQKIGVRMTGQNLGAYRSLGGTESRLLEFYSKEWEGETDRGITRNVEAIIRQNWTRRMMCIREQYGYYQSSKAAAD